MDPVEDTWNPIEPDSVFGPELDDLMEMFGDIDWRNQHAVESRVAELEALGG